MLTKTLLKIKLSKGYAYPQFIEEGDLEALSLGKKLLQTMNDAASRPQASVEEELKLDVDLENHPYGLGFIKLILDRADFPDSLGDSEERRWDLINTAQSLRQEKYFGSMEEFQEAFAGRYKTSFANLASELYADLPEFRPLKTFEPWSEEELLHRYNCALVQGLLLMAPTIRVEIKFSNTTEKRNLFRAIKFHRLVIGDISFEHGRLAFSIDGPLSVLVNTQVYGMRLANFFPHLLKLEEWNLEARIKFKGKETTLALSERNNLRSHYRDGGTYTPEGFAEFISAFNEGNDTWRAEWCEEIVALGGQDFCFPDITFVNVDGHRIHLELFHKWHKGELEKRVGVLQKMPKSQLIIGVCHSLIKENKEELGFDKAHPFGKFSFAFRSVPTPKAVNTVLDQVYGFKHKKV